MIRLANLVGRDIEYQDFTNTATRARLLETGESGVLVCLYGYSHTKVWNDEHTEFEMVAKRWDGSIQFFTWANLPTLTILYHDGEQNDDNQTNE